MDKCWAGGRSAGSNSKSWSAEPDSWSVVDSNLAGAIKSDDWEKLGIRKVGADEVIEHMMGGGCIDKVEASQFTDAEISDILIRIADEKLWKALPFIETLQMVLVPLMIIAMLIPMASLTRCFSKVFA